MINYLYFLGNPVDCCCQKLLNKLNVGCTFEFVNVSSYCFKFCIGYW